MLEHSGVMSKIMNTENLKIPIAIIVAGVFIAIAVYLSNANPQKLADNSNVQDSLSSPTEYTFTKIRPVTETDHIVGNPTADVIFIEHSDTECPFCKSFHATMNKVVDEYAKGGKVAWVYRHMPIDELHSKSRNEAEATECVASLGGEKAFWTFINRLYDATPSNNGLNPETLPALAYEVGIKEEIFTKCLADRTFKAKVQADFQDGVIATNNQPATPNSVVILKTPLTKSSVEKLQLAFAQYGMILGVSTDNTMIQFGGGLPYDIINLVIATAINQ